VNEERTNEGARACPTCGSTGAVAPFVAAKIDTTALGAFSYASRKMPEFFSLRLVTCNACETIYAPESPPEELLQRAYQDAAFDTAAEAEAAAATYDRAISAVLPKPCEGPALEIGCGTGALLPYLLSRGFRPVIGVEPSLAAVRAAPAEVRPLIRVEPFKASSFEPATFAMIGCFQTIEHLSDPSGFARDAFELLRPGGAILIVAHDPRYWLNRLLGRRSPIVDIEHLQLFSRRALQALLRRAGFVTGPSDALVNRYPLRYWLRLTPLPLTLRLRLIDAVDRAGLGGIMISFNVGNQFAIGMKPVGRNEQERRDRT
jgi:SAM-dependent methyltransferase